MEEEEGTAVATTDIPGINQGALQHIQDMWKLSPDLVQKVQKSAEITNSRYGLLSNIPIRCNGEDCPYIGTCTVDVLSLPIGNRCPIEIATLLTRFERYCTELGVTEKMAIDMGQVKELIDIEVMILRCDSKMAQSVDFIERSLVDVTKNGTMIYENKVSPQAEFKLTLFEKHSRILKDLNATRSSKKEVVDVNDASRNAAILMKRIKEMTTKQGVEMDSVLDASYCIDGDDYIVVEGEEGIDPDYVGDDIVEEDLEVLPEPIVSDEFGSLIGEDNNKEDVNSVSEFGG